MLWARLLAYVTGTVKEELLLRNEYLAAENRILKAQIKSRLLLSEEEKATLAEIAHRLGRKVLEEVAATAKPDTILGWYRKRRTLGEVGQRRMSVEANLVWRIVAASRVAAIYRTLPRGAQPSGQDNRILFPSTQARRNRGAVRCRERLGGLLKYYEREAA